MPYALEIVAALQRDGEQAGLARTYDEVPSGAVAFYLSCIRIAPPSVLAKNRRNLVVHASNLPQGRGFSPLTWQILEGKSSIPICLFEAVEELDAGPVVYRENIEFKGHELIGELREKVGRKTVDLCRRFLSEKVPPEGVNQEGVASVYPRRAPADSRLDVDKTIAEQFNLLRVVDNTNYPAWFEFRGHRYELAIRKIDDEG